MFALNIEVSDVHAILSSEMTKIKMADTLVVVWNSDDPPGVDSVHAD